MGASPIVVEREAVILANARAVWTLVQDLKLLPMWLAFAHRVEEIDGGIGGRRLRLHRTYRSLNTEMDVEVTSFEPGRLLAWRVEAERRNGKPMPRYARETRFEIWLEPQPGDATIVRLRSVQEPAGRLKGLAIAMFGRREAEFRMVKSLERLQMVASIQP